MELQSTLEHYALQLKSNPAPSSPSQAWCSIGVTRGHVRKQWGLQTRMSNKIGVLLSHRGCLNQCLGHPLMQLKDLILA